MKKLLLSLLVFFFSVAAFAQTTAHKSSVFVGLGPSLPIGDFSSKDVSDDEAGLASTGFYFDLGYQYQFSKYVGAIAMFKWKTNGIDKDALNYELPAGSGGSLSLNATTWETSNILGGLTQSFPLSKDNKLSIGFRELGGVQFTSSPELTMNYILPGIGSGSSKQDSQSATSFAYLLGLSFKYQIDNRFGLKLYSDFNNASVNFKQFTVSGSGGSTTVIPASSQNIGTIDVGVGLTISL